MCARIIVHNCRTQYSTKQFWLFCLLTSRQSSQRRQSKKLLLPVKYRKLGKVWKKFLHFHQSLLSLCFTESLRQPHSRTSSSISYSPILSPITSFSSDSPFCTSITPSLSLPAYNLPVSQILSPALSLLPPGLPSRTIARTVSSEPLGFRF